MAVNPKEILTAISWVWTTVFYPAMRSPVRVTNHSLMGRRQFSFGTLPKRIVCGKSILVTGCRHTRRKTHSRLPLEGVSGIINRSVKQYFFYYYEFKNCLPHPPDPSGTPMALKSCTVFHKTDLCCLRTLLPINYPQRQFHCITLWALNPSDLNQVRRTRDKWISPFSWFVYSQLFLALSYPTLRGDLETFLDSPRPNLCLQWITHWVIMSVFLWIWWVVKEIV